MDPERGRTMREVGRITVRWLAALTMFGAGGLGVTGIAQAAQGSYVDYHANRYNSTSDPGYINEKQAGAADIWHGLENIESGVALGLLGFAVVAVTTRRRPDSEMAVV